jgi:hypothetical protein
VKAVWRLEDAAVEDGSDTATSQGLLAASSGTVMDMF